jgi:uncharacterized protein (TIGR03435 family)
LLSRLALLAAFLIGFGQAQTTTKPEFEVVSIKPLPSTATSKRFSQASGDYPGRIRMQATTLARLIRTAYGVEDYQVIGPAWIRSERFAIEAKLPSGVTKDKVPLMLQSMLTDRFLLAFHRENREMPVYALTVAKQGVKMHSASTHEYGAGTALLPNNNRIFCGKIEISELISGLKAPGTDPAILDRPILDFTGLKGLFDIQLNWTAEPPAGAPEPEGGDGLTIFSAIQQQLGLKLESRKLPVEMIVIDQALKMPTEN